VLCSGVQLQQCRTQLGRVTGLGCILTVVPAPSVLCICRQADAIDCATQVGLSAGDSSNVL
jgi:hypothetical protein